jgi:hypothetical protein
VTRSEWLRRIQALEEAARRRAPVGEFVIEFDPEDEGLLAPYRRELDQSLTFEAWDETGRK